MSIAIRSGRSLVRLAIVSPPVVVLRPEGESFEPLLLADADDVLHLSRLGPPIGPYDHRRGIRFPAGVAHGRLFALKITADIPHRHEFTGVDHIPAVGQLQRDRLLDHPVPQPHLLRPSSFDPWAGAGGGGPEFEGLSPLPLVPEELAGIPDGVGIDRLLNKNFSSEVLLSQAADPRYERLHVATHAEFLPGGPAQARIYTGTGSISLQEFAGLRQQRSGSPLELFVLSACRTALGDSDSELGFAGLALQAGSRSAIGTLWYVDDVATSAFFLQFYRYLDQGLQKADALRATRQAMASGNVRLQGDKVIGSDGVPLLTELTPSQRRRVASGMAHPYFWAGVQLIGTPW